MSADVLEDTLPGQHVRELLGLDGRPTNVPAVTTWTAHTRTGRRRRRNEDAWGERADDGCWVVADGMGGRPAGAAAAAATVAALLATVAGRRAVDWTAAVRYTSAMVAAAEAGGDRGGGAAFAVLHHDGGRITVAHAGDVRVYRVRHGRLDLLTRDHTVAAELELGGIDPAASPFDGRQLDALTCFVGDDSSWQGFGVRSHDVAPGDRVIACTDGVHRVLRPTDWVELALLPTRSAIADSAVELALERGATDDTTCLTVDFGGSR